MIHDESHTNAFSVIKSVLLTAVISISAGNSCRSVSTPCHNLETSSKALTAISGWQWSEISLNEAIEQLPVELSEYETSFASDPNTCGGLISLRRQDRVIDGKCECCLELQFARQVQHEGCRDLLDQLIFTTNVRTKVDVRELVAQSYQILGAPAAAMGHAGSTELFSQGATYEWTSERGIEHIAARAAKSSEGVGWIVRIEHGRTFVQQ